MPGAEPGLWGSGTDSSEGLVGLGALRKAKSEDLGSMGLVCPPPPPPPRAPGFVHRASRRWPTVQHPASLVGARLWRRRLRGYGRSGSPAVWVRSLPIDAVTARFRQLDGSRQVCRARSALEHGQGVRMSGVDVGPILHRSWPDPGSARDASSVDGGWISAVGWVALGLTVRRAVVRSISCRSSAHPGPVLWASRAGARGEPGSIAR